MKRSCHYILLTLTALTCLASTGTESRAQSIAATIAVGNGPYGLAANSATNCVYVANNNGNSLSVIDAGQNAVIATIRLDSAPGGVTVNPNTNRVYVTKYSTNSVNIIDGSTNAVIGETLVGTGPYGIAVNPQTNRIYVANNGNGKVSVLDGTTNKVIATIPTGTSPYGVAVNPVTNRIYVTNANSNNLSILDGDTNTVLATVPVISPLEIAVNPTTNRVYVGSNNTSSVVVLDGDGNTITSVPVGRAPYGVAANTLTNRIYVASNLSNTVYVIDGDTNTVINMLTTGGGPYGVNVNQTTSQIYVSNNRANTVTVIGDTPADRTPPTTTAALVPVPNSSGWNNGPVTVNLSATDNSSGVKEITYSATGAQSIAQTTESGDASSLSFTAEGVTTLSFFATDNAGNTEAPKKLAVGIDKTAPTTTASVSGAAGANGWYAGKVTITLTAADSLSGVATTSYTLDGGTEQTYSAPVIVADDGAHTLAFWSVDKAGNKEAAQSLQVKIDATAPTLTWGDPTPAANANGWNNTAVDVPYTASDTLSGVAAAAPGSPVHIESEGKAQTVTVTVKDNAGNTATFTSPAVNIDLTAPTTNAALSGTQGNNGFYTGSVSVTLAATDALSGVATTYYTLDGGATQTYQGAFTVSGDAVHAVKFWSVDKAGNAEAHHSLTVKIDGTAPTLIWGACSPAANANSWNNTPVEMAYTTGDNLSGVANAPASGTIRFAQEGANQTQTLTIRDAAGNAATFQSPAVNIDMTPPTTNASVSGPASANGWYGGTVSLQLTAADALSGVTGTYCSVDGGAVQPYAGLLSLSGDGAHQVTYWSVDRAGNQEQAKSLTIRIDKTAPTITAAANPSQLWPPNGKMVAVTISGQMTDAGSGIDPTSAAFTVADSSGQIQPSGSVSVRPDGSYAFTIQLEARRSGKDKQGRTYTVTVQARDACGNLGSASAVITVPHDQR
ncbi:MAG TPA: hypothetical protein VFB38_07200 [Chthonomonadaceae bacterium]|nr:hypothetical protein [Chthonomonadaceae bacterium]